MSDGKTVTMVDAEGRAIDAPVEQVGELEAQGYRVEGTTERLDRIVADARQERFEGGWNKAAAAVMGVARGATLGLSDVALSAAGGADELSGLREVNPGSSLAGELVGSLATGKLPVPAGLAARAGAAIGRTAEGASAGARLLGAAKGAAVEGAIHGAGQGVSAVALSKDPVTLERALSTIGSSALFGGAAGGAAGLLAKGAQIGLGKVRDKLDDIAARGTGEVDDAARLAQGKEFADEVAVFRKQTVDDKLFLTVKGAKEREIRSIGKVWLDADRAVDRVLRNPKALASKPDRVMTALQQQEHALEQVIAKTDDLRASFAADTSGDRLAALNKVSSALERNRALQSRIADLTAKPAEKAGGGIVDNMIGGTAFGMVGGAVGSVLGPTAGAIAGGAAAKLLTGGLDKLAAKSAERASKAIGAFLDVTKKAPPIVPVVASKTLAAVRFADDKPDEIGPKSKKSKKSKTAPQLADSYKARVAEIKSQTMYDPTGRAVMRPEARAKVYDRLAPVRATNPIDADRMETMAARRLEFLANRIPRKPDVMGTSIGPDKWQPSDMQMRQFARYVAAVEDPMAVVERLSDGQVTPEDRDALREVYPELYADIQQQIMSQLPMLQKALPYKRRLALSIFSGIPVDPAMHPRILSVLQRQFTEEPGTEGGTMAPVPEPAFGSVKAEEPTASQRREEGATV